MRYRVIGSFFLFLFFVWGLSVAAFLFGPTTMPLQTHNEVLPTETVFVGNVPVVAEVASTEAAHEQGLSGRESLPSGSGMLFVFQSPGVYGFWMKDMQFPLDLIWVASDGTIVSIDQNVSPDSYPKTFYPAQPVQYVLEVPAGFSDTHGISPGAKLKQEK